MKICHISTEKGFRGGERQLVRIHQGLISSGENSIIICRSENCDLLEQENVFPIYFNGFGAVVAPVTIARVLKRQKPDLIHCHDSRALSLIAVVKPFLKIPVIVSRKTVYPVSLNGSTERKFRAVDHLIAVSSAAADVVHDRFPQLPVTVIHDGVECSEGKSRDEVREFLKLPKNVTLFGAVGYFSTEKNVPLLKKTADLLNEKFPDAKIVLIGPVAEKFRPLVENHPSVICAGKILQAEQLYAGFDCYLSASTREGLGSALLDAVVRDIPVIALDSGGSRDIFGGDDPDHCGDESKFLGRVEQFCQSGPKTDLVKLRGESARKRFSINQLKQKHIDLYRSMYENRNR